MVRTVLHVQFNLLRDLIQYPCWSMYTILLVRTSNKMKDLLCPSQLSDVDKFNGISLAIGNSMAIEIQLNVST